MKSRSTWLYLLPAITILAAFFVLPVVRLIPASVSSESGLGLYLEIITNPRYSTSVLSTIVLSVFVTLASLFVGGLSGLFLERHRFVDVMLSSDLSRCRCHFPAWWSAS